MTLDVETAKEMLEQAKSYWGENYKAMLEDLEFSIGIGHWSDEDKKKRGDRPALVVNQMPQFIHQVTNDMRQNTPSINITPSDELATVETAKIIKGKIKEIEYRSGADEVYDTGGEYAVKCGLGWFRIDHDFAHDEGMQQELWLKRVQNPLSVYIDPSSIECDGRDAEWAIVLDTIDKKTFEKTYPGKNFTSFDDQNKDSEESITIAEVFIKEYKETLMAVNAGGDLEETDDLKDKKGRKYRKTTIKRYKFSGDEVLESTTFPGKYIPIVPVYGEEVWVDGKRIIMSLIRQSKDAQRRYNHWVSKESEILSMAPIAPVMAAAGQVEDFADEWNNPGESMVLRFHQNDSKGNPAPVPQRLAPPPIPTGIINAMQGAAEDIKKTMGLYNASIGQRSNETSGVAIDARKVEGEVATFHYSDNRNRSIAQCGRVLLSAMKEIHDVPQLLHIIGDEEEPQVVGVNGHPMQPGQDQEHDLTQGSYDVRVSTGASYTTMRQEEAQFMADMSKANPLLWQVAGDLIVKSRDFPGAEALAARLRKTIPKELTAEEDAKKNGQEAPDHEKMQMQQVIQQMQSQMQQMAAELQSKQSDEAVKHGELQLKAKEIEIKQGELQIKAFQAHSAANQPQEMPNVEAVDNTESIKLHLEAQKQQFEQSIKERELQLKEDEFRLKVEQARLQAITSQQVNVPGDTTDPAVMQAINTVAEQLSVLANEVGRKKTVIRDPNTGLISGVE